MGPVGDLADAAMDIIDVDGADDATADVDDVGYGSVDDPPIQGCRRISVKSIRSLGSIRRHCSIRSLHSESTISNGY